MIYFVLTNGTMLLSYMLVVVRASSMNRIVHVRVMIYIYRYLQTEEYGIDRP